MRITPVVISIIKKGNKYLMTKRVIFDDEDKKYSPFVWNIPGGGLDFGETPEEAVIRESREELGVEIKIIKQVNKVFTDVRGNWQGIFIVFLNKLKDENSIIKLNEEADQYKWATIEEIRKLPLMPKTIEMLEEADKI